MNGGEVAQREVGDAGALTAERVQRWARDLIDLSQRNHALYHRPTKRSSLDILSPDPLSLHRVLTGTKPLSFFIPPSEDAEDTWSVEDMLEHAGPTEIVTDRTEAQDLIRTLTHLMRSANQDWLDRAVRTLYVSFSQLVWVDHSDSRTEVRSPLVYFPVILRRGNARQPFLLQRTEDDPVLNPSLVMKLEDSFGIDLTALAEGVAELSTMDEVIEQIEELVDPLGWRVEHAAALKRATFHKESMYRDLQGNLESISGHPLVRALAGHAEGKAIQSTAGLPREPEIDAFDPPEEAHLVLDADASQRLAVIAAKHGVSFVMDGPPGTGKSQTIVNMIAELIASNRSVLFVSEKAAALEVVAKRLADVGLSDFVLELHSHKANRREVVQELARCVLLKPHIEGSMEESDRRRLKDRRAELSDYATAVNEIRLPLARSVSWVAGRVLALHDAPELEPPEADLQSLDLPALDAVLEDSRVLTATWDRIHSPEFLWRDAENLEQPNGDQARRVIGAVSAKLAALEAASAARAHAIGMQTPDNWAEVDEIAARLELMVARPDEVPVALLASSVAEFAALQREMKKFEELTEAARKADGKLDRSFPDGWRSSVVPTPELIEQTTGAAEQVFPRRTTREVTLTHVEKALSKASELMKECDRLVLDVEDLASVCGFSLESMTIERAARIANVAGRSKSHQRPEWDWLAAGRAREVRSVLDQILASRRAASFAMANARGLIQEKHLEDNLHLDLSATLKTVLQTRGRPSALSGRARHARRAAAEAVTKRLKDLTEQDVDRISAAWMAQQAVAEVEARHRSVLDRFIVGTSIDVEGAEQALELAIAVREAGGASMRHTVAATHFCGERPANTEVGQRGKELERSIRSLQSDLRALREAGIQLPTESRLDELAEALRIASDVLLELARLVRPALGRRSGETSLADLTKDLKLLDEAREADRAVAEGLTALEEAAGLSTAPDASTDARIQRVSLAATWVKEIRRAFGDGLALPHAAALVAVNVGDDEASKLRGSAADLQAALESFERFVGKRMSRRLRPRLGSTFSGTAERLAELSASADQLAEWWEHADARRSFAENGLESLLEHAARLNVPAEIVPRSVERAVLARWLEQVLRGDRRLQHLNASKRNSRVAEFQRMDRALMIDAARRVVESCAAQLPQGNLGAVGLILKEAHKKARHLPVRTLFEQVGPELSRLKPCLMMSPLSVSQYIPPDWRFDVVIFDEASQIPPQDAINCIYRGEQLVIAGDDRQLPPTAFFEILSKDDEDDVDLDDFESVLGLAKGSAALADLGLRWHYRSRHEDLITFSNQRFYDGELVTYPGALTASPTLGVVHHLVPDGVYHRGSRKDNPKEAEKVAEIVANHVRQSPHLSIGVVALSSAQAEAIEDAVDRLRRTDPDLDRAFRSDRLNGFFVKNLENVQGDDRDIIVLSIGYGPDSAGKMTMNFGPMNQSGGWRRLNVAVTRARSRMDVVSSFTSDRLRPSDPAGSLAALQAYLSYAEDGARTVLTATGASRGEAESPLEEEVLRTIRSWGYEAVPQVGSAGYRIDIGILDPDDSSRYMIGVECDGAAYHSSKVARDRDRLRQQVLEGLGWRLYRVWGPSWFRNRSVAEELLRNALDDARTAPPLSPAASSPPARSDRAAVRIVHEQRSIDGPPEWAVPYVQHAPRRAGLPSPTTPSGRAKLRELLLTAARTEAPVHVSRLRDIANAALRVPVLGALEHTFLEGIDSLRSDGLYHYDDGFVREEPCTVLVRYPDGDGLRRSIDQIPPEEIDLAVMRLLQDALAATPAEIERGVRDIFGFRRVGGRISEAVADAIGRLELEGDLRQGPLGKLSVAPGRQP